MNHGSRIVWRSSITGFLFVLPQVAWADDEIRASVDVTTSTGWSSNPFAEVGKNLGSAEVQIDVRPVVSMVAEHSIISLSGLLDYQHFFRNYSDSKDYGGGLDYSGTLGSRLTAHANAHYDSSIIGGFDAINPVINPALPQPPVTSGQDIALIGTRDRRSTLSFSGDVGYALSARSSVTANAYYSRVRYAGVESGSNYNSYGGGAGYSRRISERLQLGLQASTARYVYRGLLGKSQVYSLQATFNDRLSEKWTLLGAAGVSFSDQSFGGRRTNLTGNAQLCRQTSRATLCFTASDAVLPTGATGTVNSKAAGASYSYRLSERSTFTVSGQYSHNDEPVFNRLAQEQRIASSYVTAAASYDRQLRQRIHLIAATHFRKVIGNLGNYPADFGGSLGISIRFGDFR